MYLKLILVVGLWFAVFSAYDATIIKSLKRKVKALRGVNGIRLGPIEEAKLASVHFSMLATLKGKFVQPGEPWVVDASSPYRIPVTEKEGDVYTTLWLVYLVNKDNDQEFKENYCWIKFTISNKKANLVREPECVTWKEPDS